MSVPYGYTLRCLPAHFDLLVVSFTAWCLYVTFKPYNVSKVNILRKQIRVDSSFTSSTQRANCFLPATHLIVMNPSLQHNTLTLHFSPVKLFLSSLFLSSTILNVLAVWKYVPFIIILPVSVCPPFSRCPLEEATPVHCLPFLQRPLYRFVCHFATGAQSHTALQFG